MQPTQKKITTPVTQHQNINSCISDNQKLFGSKLENNNNFEKQNKQNQPLLNDILSSQTVYPSSTSFNHTRVATKNPSVKKYKVFEGPILINAQSTIKNKALNNTKDQSIDVQQQNVMQPTQKTTTTPITKYQNINSCTIGNLLFSFENADNSKQIMKNQNTLQNNEKLLFGSNLENSNNFEKQRKQNQPRVNDILISQRVYPSSTSFSYTGVQVSGVIPQLKSVVKNENLFGRTFINEEKIMYLQQENKNLFASLSKDFQKEHASQFENEMNDAKQVQYWNIIFTSIQSEENLFFNFSGFQNEFDQILYNLEDGQKFTDKAFPNVEPVLEEFKSNYQFRRAEEIYQNTIKLFGKINPNKVRQGKIYDCYLISCITAMAKYPELCKKLFVQKEKNDKCIYGIWICESGEWNQFVIDDYLVCTTNGGNPCFAQYNGIGIWVQLLEKAYAKCYGGYSEIEYGKNHDCLRDLTGSPVEQFDIIDNFGQIFDTIKQSLKDHFILALGSKLSTENVQSNHSFTIQDAREVVNFEGQQVKLLKIKNPWGVNLDKNQIQDKSIENQLGESLCQKEGILWLTEKEVLADFNTLQVCYTLPGFICGSYTTANKINEFFYVQNLTESNHCYFSVYQKSEKYYWKGFQKQNNNYYKMARLIITQIDPDKQQIIDVIGGTYSNKSQAIFEVKSLPKGEFLVFVEVDGKYAPQIDQFTLQTYSKNIVSITPAFNFINFKVTESEIIETIFKLYIKKINKQPDWNTKVYLNTKGAGLVIRDISKLFGYQFISYRNESITQFTEFFETPREFGIDLYNFDKTSRQKFMTLVLEPGEMKVLLYRILENNDQNQTLNLKAKRFFKSIESEDVKSPVKPSYQPTLAKQMIKKPKEDIFATFSNINGVKK